MNYSRDNSRSASTATPYTQFIYGLLAYAPRLLALLVLLIYFPAILAAGLLVALTSPGPVFVKKAYRRGNGSEDVVYLYELRTECWQTGQPTPLGKFLYLCDVHRLPRLVNVLQGDVRVGERVRRLQS